ncbi:glycosyltransferase family 4 protein [Pseudobacteroides cellulosolvens]|uniref:Glycosyl transferase group 1 n=1 Tax=Pseudobacteroides cellulosolvens ATCC 35603 = DSM 2933 TaxID=398512 RepID=A0A0L6JLU9_9FIRM|nr:glycosyltransferase family 4 protein [Pseudobacteroides cellulosolvens]KNY26377.1 glycosyl transferase group 1 [Pseudobacteroides cellulosolvens ATCC 35603 = DSM 2933]
MKDILIIAHFTQIPGEYGNGRFNYIAEKIDKSDACVELVTSSFSHRTKTQRIITKHQINDISYKLTMLYEPGYSKNISIERFYSHYIMGKSLKDYLATRKKPDVIYCAVPSLDVAKVATKYAKKNNIRLIIDVQDLWPEAFKMVFNIPLISNIILWPIKKKAEYIYRNADDIVAVSQTYVDRAIKVNKKCKKGHAVFLGTELSYFDNLAKENKALNKVEGEIRLVYIGTLGHSYNLTNVMDALKLVKEKGISNIKFIVIGDGPLKSKFQNYAKEKNVDVEFCGRLDYGKMVSMLLSCDIAVNPIKNGSAGSIINKVGDYAAAGLPVLNTQESSEYRGLVNKYKIGLNCKNDPNDLAKKLLVLYSRNQLRKKMGYNNRRLADMKFDRKYTYSIIVELIKLR